MTPVCQSEPPSPGMLLDPVDHVANPDDDGPSHDDCSFGDSLLVRVGW
jgi:hypothetical protein